MFFLLSSFISSSTGCLLWYILYLSLMDYSWRIKRNGDQRNRLSTSVLLFATSYDGLSSSAWPTIFSCRSVAVPQRLIYLSAVFSLSSPSVTYSFFPLLIDRRIFDPIFNSMLEPLSVCYRLSKISNRISSSLRRGHGQLPSSSLPNIHSILHSTDTQTFTKELFLI